MINFFRDNHWFLSNFYPCGIMYEGTMYPSVEHAFQAAKTLDLETRDRIRKSDTRAAKRLGRSVELRADWENIKLQIMEDLVRQKFTLNLLLKEKLRETESEELVEGNWWGDKFWGVCNGVGENHLGKILMKIRSELS